MESFKNGDKVVVIELEDSDIENGVKLGMVGTIDDEYDKTIFPDVKFNGIKDKIPMRLSQLELYNPAELKDGYVLEITNHNKGSYAAMVFTNVYGELCVSTEDQWFNISSLDTKTLSDDFRQIDKIYDRTNTHESHMVSTNHRELLWERNDEKLELGDIVWHKYSSLGEIYYVVSEKDGFYYLEGVDGQSVDHTSDKCESLNKLLRVMQNRKLVMDYKIYPKKEYELKPCRKGDE